MELLQRLQHAVTDNLRADGDERPDGRWLGHRVFLLDGSSFSMPDTPALRQHFGQPAGQAEGCGFPTAHLMALFDAQPVKHFSSWLGLCPNWKKTGGKVKSSQTRKGKNRAATALRLAAWSLIKSKSYLGAHLRRLRSRLGAPKAITATAHKLARILYNLMRYGLASMKQSEAAYAEQVHQRLEKQLQRRARERGYTVTKMETPATVTVE